MGTSRKQLKIEVENQNKKISRIFPLFILKLEHNSIESSLVKSNVDNIDDLSQPVFHLLISPSITKIINETLNTNGIHIMNKREKTLLK